jgi:hypothetical protein
VFRLLLDSTCIPIKSILIVSLSAYIISNTCFRHIYPSKKLPKLLIFSCLYCTQYCLNIIWNVANFLFFYLQSGHNIQSSVLLYEISICEHSTPLLVWSASIFDNMYLIRYRNMRLVYRSDFYWMYFILDLYFFNTNNSSEVWNPLNVF